MYYFCDKADNIPGENYMHFTCILHMYITGHFMHAGSDMLVCAWFM